MIIWLRNQSKIRYRTFQLSRAPNGRVNEGVESHAIEWDSLRFHLLADLEGFPQLLLLRIRLDHRRVEDRVPVHPGALHLREDLGDLYAESGQTLQGSFLAISSPIF